MPLDTTGPAGRTRRYAPAGLPVGAAILLLLVAVAVVPVLDDIAGFLADAPYVRLLPLMVDRGQDAAAEDALAAAWQALSQFLAQPVL